MRLALKKKIIEWIFDNTKESQIANRCVDTFREYIYDKNGNYLIGGDDVYEFIISEIALITNEFN